LETIEKEAVDVQKYLALGDSVIKQQTGLENLEVGEFSKILSGDGTASAELIEFLKKEGNADTVATALLKN
jgi:hypothetical protein